MSEVHSPTSVSSGLARYDRSGQEIDWRTRQQVARIEADRSVTRAIVDASEREQAHVMERVIEHGERLAEQAVQGVQRLDREIRETTRHNPNLEYACREIQEVFARAAANHISRYMSRER